ncbi:porin [Litoribacter ruber]|uniref:outer membrane beta-barrel protein n=1 Tax=Litoribacter ruber TaxID=702568 RepID=UPI001BD96450|nr:outer membrane beta-barrel protein [Litoribacter ruber]MBT0812399.1 porin [Litoribacter ruber]
MKHFYLLLFLLISHFSKAQIIQQNGWELSGHMEAYYSYEFNRPENHQRPDFLYNYKRHNEFSVNLAFIRAKYEDENIRGNLALMTGTYAQFNLADEPAWAQMVYEASVGVRLYDKLWLDVGIMPSHIGFESAEGMETWHLSRSLLAENSPYFLTGGRLTYMALEDLEVTLWAGNGWQNVQRQEGHQSLALGLGLNYQPLEGLEINYSNFFGNEYPQTLRLNRFYNNFYTMYSFSKWGVTVGADYGVEEAIFRPFNEWYAFTASLRRQLGEKFYLALRADHYSDVNGVILNSGLEVTGYSVNLDYQVHPKALARIELRQFNSPEPIFDLPGGRVSTGNTAINSSLAIRF